MFEDKRKKRKRRYILLLLLFFFMVAAFGVGYYFNSGDPENILKPASDPNTQLKIPDSLINPPASKTASEEVDDLQETQEISNIPVSDVVTPQTAFIFKTRFTLCGHVVEKSAAAEAEINMTEAELQNRYHGWSITRFTPQLVQMEKNIATHCPRHYILGIDSGNIAIFQYNDEGRKVLLERTDISVSTLTPEDQKSLESGIIADTEDDLNLKLEGFSD